MRIKVIHVVNGSTHTHEYTCTDATRQLNGADGVNIVFRDGSGRDAAGNKVLTAQYRQADVMITYDDTDSR